MILAFKTGIQIGMEKSQSLRKKLLKADTEKKLAEARLEVVKKYFNQPTSDIIDSAISEGERLTREMSNGKTDGSDSGSKN